MTFKPRNYQIPTEVATGAISLARFVGYALLAFSLLDYLAILIPPRLLDSGWEFDTMGQLVEHIWAPLIGFVLVFWYTDNDTVSWRGLRVLSFLSWASLVLGIVYLLMLPLAIFNTVDIYNNINANINAQAFKQKQQLEQLKQHIAQTNSPEELVAISKYLSPGNPLQNKGNLQELKTQLSQQVQQASNTVTASSEQVAKQRSRSLIKAAVKLNIGAILSGVSLIVIWNLTSWARMWYKNG